MAKSICRSTLQQKALWKTKSKLKLLYRLDFLWYNGTYESRSVKAKVDMHFCSNVVSLANVLFLLKNSNSSYYNQCKMLTVSIPFSYKSFYSYQEYVDKSGNMTIFFITVNFLLICSIYVSNFLGKSMLFVRTYTLRNIFKNICVFLNAVQL